MASSDNHDARPPVQHPDRPTRMPPHLLAGVTKARLLLAALGVDPVTPTAVTV